MQRWKSLPRWLPRLRELWALLIVFELAVAFGISSAPDHTELHVVCLHEGSPSQGQNGLTAAVHVDRPHKTVQLVLCAYNSITWTVTASEHTRISQIVLGGYHTQHVGPALKVPVIERFHDRPNADHWLESTYSKSSVRFRPMIQSMHQYFGRDVASFFGKYRLATGEVVVVKSTETDQRLRGAFPEPDRVFVLPPLYFMAMEARSHIQGHFVTDYGEHSLSGPTSANRIRLSGLFVSVFENSMRQIVGVRNGFIDTFDINGNLLERRAIDQAQISIGAVDGAVFDAESNQVLLLGRHICALDWKTLTPRPVFQKLKSKDWVAFCVNNTGEGLIGLNVPHGDWSAKYAEIVIVDKEGKITKAIRLPDKFFPGIVPDGTGSARAQLMSIGNYVVTITGPRVPAQGRLPPTVYYYLTDLRNGVTKLVLCSKLGMAK